jgi:hypothetical protein
MRGGRSTGKLTGVTSSHTPQEFPPSLDRETSCNVEKPGGHPDCRRGRWRVAKGEEMRSFVFVLLTACAVGAGAEASPRVNNIYGAHLVNESYGRGVEKLRWIRHLVGEYGYAKLCIFGITGEASGAAEKDVKLIEECHRLHLIPIVRLGGIYDGMRGHWEKPVADAPGDYSSMAAAVKSIVSDLPRTEEIPLYVEIWNEPACEIEWSHEPDMKEYGLFLVQVSRAIRSIGDPNVKILNGAFALSPESAEEMFLKVPESVQAFDVWGSHPYPHNQPPWMNLASGNTLSADLCIDAYVQELDVLERFGRGDAPVMLVETGYDLGNATFTDPGLPIIDEVIRAEYIVSAFRDYWSKDPRILAVTPFLFCDPGWERFNWVHSDSGSHPDGSPTRPYYQYTCIAALAKPTDLTGAINGKVTESSTGHPLALVQISSSPGGATAETNIRGNFFLPALEPGEYRVRFEVPYYQSHTEDAVQVERARNSILNVQMVPEQLASLRGRVSEGETGAPVPEARVKLEPSGLESETDRTGGFLFDRIPPLAYRLTAQKPGFTEHAKSNVNVVPASEDPVMLRISSSRTPDVPNLLTNPSFEEGFGQVTVHGIALRWESLTPGQYGMTDQVSRSGDAAQSMLGVGRHSCVRQITNYNTAEPGRRYHASVWAKCRDLAGQAWLRFCFTDNGGAAKACHESSVKITGDAEWTEMELEGIAPEGSKRVSVELHVEAGKGIAYFDDAFLGIVE